MNVFPTSSVYDELNTIFSDLRRNGIEVVILKSEREYNSNNIISDVDIYTHIDNKLTLREELTKMGFDKIDSFRNFGVREFYSKVIGGALIKLDVSYVFCCYDGNLVFRPCVEINYKKGVDNNNYLTEKSSSIFILKNALIKGYFKKNKAKYIHKDFLAAITSGDEIDLKKSGDIVNNFFHNGELSKISYYTYMRRLITKLFRKKRKICFVGVDGSGKGTYIRLLQSSLQDIGFQTEYVYLGHSQYKLRCMQKLVGLKSIVKHKWLLRLTRIAYIILFPLELMYRKKWSEADITIYDRHTRFEPVFKNKLLSVYNFICNICSSRPDLIIYLHGDKKMLWERKKEMDYSCFVRKCDEIDELVKKSKGTINIITINSTNREVNKIYDEVWDVVHRFIKKDKRTL